MPKGEAGRYVDAFGAAGMASLNGRLRALGLDLSVALSGGLSPEMLAEALGTPTRA
ncbi:MAG: hypothetical protein AB7G13_09200 [Lautropia sp.]